MADTNIMKQIADKIKDSNNVLVTVNSNPTVDELSAALGITLFINKLDKHATAVFSGAVPPAIEFLEPEKTFENTVDSLRDFIIALDKEKADHLRYKVVDDMVKIFITPYRTTLSEADLEFSQGDYNVEVVLAIGVKTEADLDRALESHGRIMHDATVAAISLGEPTKLGGLEWVDGGAGSYSEMLYDLADALKSDKAKIDGQISTAFLTGIVAATDRFSNNFTTSKVMTVAAQLMSAGANQQLISTELQKSQAISATSPVENPPAASEPAEQPADAGSLSISHVPEGTLEEVTQQVGEAKSDEALEAANEELAQTRVQLTPPQPPADAEQALAEDLAANVPAAGQPVVPATPGPLRGAVSVDQWKSRVDTPAEIPSMGGTLNATTEQAAEDAKKAVDDDRNRTILSHGGTGYIGEEPSFQAPINAVSSDTATEPAVKDILSAPAPNDVTVHVDAIQPPAPVAPHEPTLAEIDAQNRAHDDARAAIDAALSPDATPPPVLTQPPEIGGLPPLPPMPDFSTLPPLPPELSQFSAPPAASEPVPLPAADPVPAVPTADDPAQFRIPGQ